MDLKEAWKNLQKEKLNVPLTAMIAIPKRSRHPVTNLIRSFTIGLGFCVLFGLLFLALIFLMDQAIVKVGLAVVTFSYGILFTVNWRLLKRMKGLYHSDEKVLKVLQGVHAIVTQTISFQQKFLWVFFPICVAGGFVLGLSMKKDAATMMVQPKFYVSLLITMAIITPAAFYLTKWFTKISHGKYLKQIEDLIAQAKEG